MPAGAEITKVVVHMYKMGTGDSFVLKFYDGNKIMLKMLIDCGCWSKRKHADIIPFVQTIRDDVNGHIDVLVVTHEHLDHVLGFHAARDVFKNEITIGEIWMGWTEEDGDPDVDEWKEKYAERTMAILKAANEVKARLDSPDYTSQYAASKYKDEIHSLHSRFKNVLSDFAVLHADGDIKPGQAGMEFVKNILANNNIKFFKPGTVMRDITGLPDVKVFVLGPPLVYESVKQESGGEGESYDHNNDIDADDLLLKALDLQGNGQISAELFPFDKYYETNDVIVESTQKTQYESEEWRKIDFDWLFSSGSLALRMNSLTNNLSLALAFQFPEDNKVILFPGDAEYGSWKSWHDIDWSLQGEDIETKDLLANTVFYKVAHHLSHNGTAKNLGLSLMKHKDLAAMATLDYTNISDGWKSTMPNKLIIKDLLTQTKGRLMIMNPDGLFYDLDELIPLQEKIDEFIGRMSDSEKNKFIADFDNSHAHYVEYTVRL